VRRSKIRSTVAVVGGVYRERCAKPFWDEVFGSGGRAASALARVGVTVQLHAYADALNKEAFLSRAAMEKFEFHPTMISRSLSFDYIHGLDTPRISLSGDVQKPLHVTVENVVRFGMLEGDAIVQADRAVYDPQNVDCPVHFGANGSCAKHLALVLNRAEAAVLARMPKATTAELASALQRQAAAEVVVIKQGPLGAFVLEGPVRDQVPAYQSERVWKIGSGDMFVAHFAFGWLAEGRSAAESAELASRATAFYCETRGSASPAQLAAFPKKPVTTSSRFRKGYRPVIYLAGPFFTLANLWLIEQARSCLLSMGLSVFSPYHDVGHGSAEDVVSKDLAAIDGADMVFAIGDGMDSGTVYEVGYARAKGKPVVVYCENETAEAKKMMQGSECILCDDFVTAIYRSLWVACAA
jgi:nucleoside 2-deoxyribosyltransferase